MIELIHTSQPSGLLPGTHGFSTVAMTEGLSDSLRKRLESLSAYRHLYSGNDGDYLKKNPVAWNHLLLSTGEHVLSRVAATSFDYTGRTNRLAHHLAYSREEFGGANAAEELFRHGALLSAPWSGEPRWLPASPPAPLPRGETDLRPSHWIRFMGEEAGTRTAAVFATMLAGRIADNGRPLLFLDSLERDPDAMLLLGLIRDLLALLPDDLRAKATFSTYPADFPAGISCFIQGRWAEDGDVAASPSKDLPAFDLRSGRGTGGDLPGPDNLFLLAAQTGKRAIPVAMDSAGTRRATGRPDGAHGTGDRPGGKLPVSRPSPAVQTPATSAAARFLEPGRGKKAWLLPLVVSCVVLALALIAAFLFLKPAPAPSILPIGEELGPGGFIAPPESIQPLPEAFVEKEKTDEALLLDSRKKEAIELILEDYLEGAERGSPSARRQKLLLLIETTNRVAAISSPEVDPFSLATDFGEAFRKLDVPAEEKPRAESGEEIPPPPEALGSSEPSLPFVKAEKIKINEMPSPLDGYWYYDAEGTLRNSARKPGRSETQEAPFVLGYRSKDRTLYWQWKIGEARTKTLKGDGGETRSLRLDQICFGREGAVAETWIRLTGRTPSYRVLFSWDATRYVLTNDTGKLTEKDLLSHIELVKMPRLVEQARSLRASREDAVVKQEALRASLREVIAIIEELEGKHLELEKLDQAIEELEKKAKTAKSKGLKELEEKISKKKAERKTSAEAIRAFLDAAHPVGDRKERRSTADGWNELKELYHSDAKTAERIVDSWDVKIKECEEARAAQLKVLHSSENKAKLENMELKIRLPSADGKRLL